MKQPTKKQLISEIDSRGSEPINELVVACQQCGEVMWRGEAEKVRDILYEDGNNVYLCKKCHHHITHEWKSNEEQERT